MPVIVLWAEAAAPWEAAVHRWLKNMQQSTVLMEKWLRLRVPAAERLDEKTRDFPILRYYNTALTAMVTEMQFGSLLDAPVMSVGDHVERALEKWNVKRNVDEQKRSAELPGEALQTIDEIATGILRSLLKFETVDKDSWDPKKRTAVDLIGLAGLAWTTVGGNREGIYQAIKRTTEALGIPANDNWRGRAPPKLPLEMRIDQLTRYVVAGLLVIPALSRILRQTGKDALTLVRYRALAKFEEYERKFQGYRKRMFVAFYNGIAAVVEVSIYLILRVGQLITDYVGAFANIGTDYVKGLASGLAEFTKQLPDLWKGIIDVINQVVGYVGAITQIDIGEVLHNALETVGVVIEWFTHMYYDDDNSPPAYGAPAQFSVTVGQLVLKEGPGVKANEQLEIATTRLAYAVHNTPGTWPLLHKAALHKWGGIHIDNTIFGLERVIAALNLPRDSGGPQEKLKLDFGKQVDISATIIKPLGIKLNDAIGKLGTAADSAVGDVFTAAQGRLDGTAATFHKAAQAAAAWGPKGFVAKMVGDADAFLKKLFGDQSPEGRKTGMEALALAFATWMQGGFDTIALVADRYVRFMLDEWAEQIGKNEDLPLQVTPTSPKKLLERAELGRVHMPRLRIHAINSVINEPLANQVAGEFKEAIEEAYRSGLGRLAEFTELAA